MFPTNAECSIINGIDQDSNTLQKELDELLEAAQEQPGVSELLEIVDHANEATSGYAVEVNEYRFIGSTSTANA